MVYKSHFPFLYPEIHIWTSILHKPVKITCQKQIKMQVLSSRGIKSVKKSPYLKNLSLTQTIENKELIVKTEYYIN